MAHATATSRWTGGPEDPARGELALVMSGGGARAAYQVGVLRHLARSLPHFEPPIVTGVSAGAINAVYLAAREEEFGPKVDGLAELWTSLSTERVFRADVLSLFGRALRWALRLSSGGATSAPHVRGLVDTEPLRETLFAALQSADGSLPGIARNLDRGRLRALAITASDYATGQSVTFTQGREVDAWSRAHRVSRRAEIRVEHVLASAALPVFFPAVRVPAQGPTMADGRRAGWFGDGGMRLTAPFSPAIHLGARRLLAISTRTERNADGEVLPAIDGYPPPVQVMGALLNAIFLDQFDADALRLERVNQLIRGREDELPLGMRPVQLFVLRPSRDLGALANAYEPDLPWAFRYLTRSLGTKETRSNDLLSLLMFQGDYLRRLMELGEEDAAARHDELVEFLAAPAGARP